MMTVREALGRKMRRAIATAFAGVGLFLVQALVPTQGPPLFVFAGMAVFFSAAMYLNLGIPLLSVPQQNRLHFGVWRFPVLGFETPPFLPILRS